MRGFIGVVFQPEHGIKSLDVSRLEPQPGQPVERFDEVALWLDESADSRRAI